jgi:hypothetical protein
MAKSVTANPANNIKNVIKASSTKQATEAHKSKELSINEKKLLKRYFKTEMDEFEAIARSLNYISSHPLVWFKEQSARDSSWEPIVLEVYQYSQTRWSRACLNSQSYYARCNYNGRTWRCKSLKELGWLIKALKKDLPIRYPDFDYV